jgi:hypothetical protein
MSLLELSVGSESQQKPDLEVVLSVARSRAFQLYCRTFGCATLVVWLGCIDPNDPNAPHDGLGLAGAAGITLIEAAGASASLVPLSDDNPSAHAANGGGTSCSRGRSGGDAPCQPTEPTGDSDAGQNDPITPGDDRAGYVSCGDMSCGPGTYCCGGVSCATPDACTSFPGDRCDGPEDCASGERCFVGMVASACASASPIDTARCHKDADCSGSQVCNDGGCATPAQLALSPD